MSYSNCFLRLTFRETTTKFEILNASHFLHDLLADASEKNAPVVHHAFTVSG